MGFYFYQRIMHNYLGKLQANCVAWKFPLTDFSSLDQSSKAFLENRLKKVTRMTSCLPIVHRMSCEYSSSCFSTKKKECGIYDENVLRHPLIDV